MSKTVFTNTGKTWSLTTDVPTQLKEQLSPGYYSLVKSPFDIFYLEEIDGPVVKGKSYGDLESTRDHVLAYFEKSGETTAFLGEGEKGSGKSRLMNMICVEAVKRGMVVITLQEPFLGTGFINLLQSIKQPAIIFADEVDRLYDSDDQEKLLTVLSGTAIGGPKLFLFTTNSVYNINEYMMNRPERIRYMKSFHGVSLNIAVEFCEDNLKVEDPETRTAYLKEIQETVCILNGCNFDMLRAWVGEINMFGTSPKEAIKLLNISSSFAKRESFDVTVSKDGKPLATEMVYRGIWNGNPMVKPVIAAVRKSAKGKYEKYIDLDGSVEELAKEGWLKIEFTPDQLSDVNLESRTFTFTNPVTGFSVTLAKQIAFTHWLAM